MSDSADTKQSYDKVAGEYSAQFSHELDHKPFDRDLLDRFARRLAGQGKVADIGCGPGHVAAYLHARGVDVVGIDLSPEMVKYAAQNNPDIEFMPGDMRALDLPANSLAGIDAFTRSSISPAPKCPTFCASFRRILKPGGLLLLSFHEGEEIRHFDEWWGQQVNLDFLFFTRAEMQKYLSDADFLIEEVYDREPYEGFEVATHRVYILAQKPEV